MLFYKLRPRNEARGEEGKSPFVDKYGFALSITSPNFARSVPVHSKEFLTNEKHVDCLVYLAKKDNKEMIQALVRDLREMDTLSPADRSAMGTKTVAAREGNEDWTKQVMCEETSIKEMRRRGGGVGDDK